MIRLGRLERLALAVFAAVLSACLVGGSVLHRQIADHNNALQLSGLAQQLIRRAEKAVDFVVIANSQILIADHAACDRATETMLRELVLDTGTVSNIFMVTPTRTCSSFGELSAVLPPADVRGQWVEARNPAYRFGGITRGESTLLGVSRGFGTELELIAAISADALLFDVLPAELRNDGRVDLSIDGDILASFIGTQAQDSAAAAPSNPWASFAASGSRYPFHVDILVEPEALAAWHARVSTPVFLAWLAFSTLVAALAAWAVVRGRDPLLEDVKWALKTRQIVPHFQPIVDIRSGAVIGCEALARWTRADGFRVPPERFIPLVEQHGLNDRLLAILIGQAATGLRAVLDAQRDFYVGFNVTPQQLSCASFADEMIALARAHALLPSQICIEITERQVIASPTEAAETTTKLKQAGFRIAVDDAGTGHNGLAALQMLDANTIKIDKFFVDHISHDPRSRVMIDMFVSVARRYQMKTIAEGVETQDQITVLKAAGVDAVQGYVHAPAMPAAEFEAFTVPKPALPGAAMPLVA